MPWALLLSPKGLWALYQGIIALKATFEFAMGAIDKAIYDSRIQKIHDAVSKAQTGKLEDRLEGGSDLEDIANRRAPK